MHFPLKKWGMKKFVQAYKHVVIFCLTVYFCWHTRKYSAYIYVLMIDIKTCIDMEKIL